MHRILCVIITAIYALCISAQELTDSIAVADSIAELQQDSLVGDAHAAETEIVPVYTSESLYRSWLKNNSLDAKRRDVRFDLATNERIDTLRRQVFDLPIDRRSMRYLYDMRLPLISTGVVPVVSPVSVGGDVALLDSLERLPESFVSDQSRFFSQQNYLEDQRLLARFNYASADLRRYRFARREFDVPTANSQVLDTESSLQNTRIVDEVDLDFSNASLEDFGQSLVIKADKWHWKGDHTLQMQQTALSDNWYKGGDNNMSLSGDQKLAISRYDENQKTTFEMLLDLKLSAYYTTADTVHHLKVSDNLFTWDIKYGYKAWKKWYYSAQLYAKTPVFEYFNSNDTKVKSSFLSPLEVNLSLGMDYKYTSPSKRFVYSLLLAPLSYNVKYVKDDRVNETSYGLKEGDSFLHEFGSTLTNKFDWKMGQNATWSSRLYCFTSYRKVLVEFENTFSFNISRFFSARIYAYPRFDDSLDSEVQFKEMVTFGFNYAW